ncbi:glutamyl-tRNA amidotransferase [Mesomycoplasma conjunctivae]|uniref:glutamyl-tRNA amidotransferase n=1 Tax=Mesomycoplasma conjunctivae TaxID=45361 RepID=UPI003DA409BC
MKKETVIDLAKKLKFVPTQDVIDVVLSESKLIKKSIYNLYQFDTSNVLPMDKVHEHAFSLSLLREDVAKVEDYRDVLFKNSVHSENENIKIKRVIND